MVWVGDRNFRPTFEPRTERSRRKAGPRLADQVSAVLDAKAKGPRGPHRRRRGPLGERRSSGPSGCTRRSNVGRTATVPLEEAAEVPGVALSFIGGCSIAPRALQCHRPVRSVAIGRSSRLGTSESGPQPQDDVPLLILTVRLSASKQRRSHRVPWRIVQGGFTWRGEGECTRRT